MLNKDFCGWCTQRRAECVGQEEAMERLSQLYGPADDE